MLWGRREEKDNSCQTNTMTKISKISIPFFFFFKWNYTIHFYVSNMLLFFYSLLKIKPHRLKI